MGQRGPFRAPACRGNTPSSAIVLRSDAFIGTNVFVLFDTSNFMYRGFVYASDAIADFVRGLDRADSVAVYTFSRNLTRAASLTRDRSDAICRPAKSGRRRRYGALQRPAADPARCRQGARPQGRDRLLQRSRQRQHGGSGRRPRRGRGRGHSDLRDLDQRGEQGPDLERTSSSASSQRTGGKAYFAKTWQKQVEAFESIREDLGNSYTVTYYPQPNPNEGFRKITIEITSEQAKKYKIRARPGYRPQRGF